MNSQHLARRTRVLVAAVALAVAGTMPAAAQDSAAPAAEEPTCRPQAFFAMPPYRSVEALPDGRVTFRLCAPEAHDVRLVSVDVADVIPMNGGLPMARAGGGLWEVTTSAPIAPDTYRYNFQVDGLRVPDPAATTFSRERKGINSTFEISGEAGNFQAWHADVPHGTVTRVDYWSAPLAARRSALVYTPPGYMNGTRRYPVLYLVHGAGDSEDSWTSVGHADAILDNLLASGAAQEMIVVMPAGHTPDRTDGTALLANGDFGADLHQALIPLIDATFRTHADAAHRAMAGLSMGGSHTLRFGLTRPDVFSRVGIFSMGLGTQPDDIAAYTAANDAMLRRAAQDMQLVYYAMGTEDFLHPTVAPTRDLLGSYGIEHVYNETGGGHTWINWRRYLADFLPRLDWTE